ncbi:MAG: tetratricopeptide repeat protein, partial [Myxococcales bacterium]|nr:tetratricopeptide repeat protein [Myxococcales bacterium]
RAYQEAIYAAAASGHGKIEAQALIGMVSVLGSLEHDIDGALHYGNHAEAVLERIGNPPALRAGLALYRGNTLMGANQLEQSLEQFRLALSLADGVLPAERIYLAALNNVAAVLGQQGKYREAIASFEEAAKLTEARLGPWHPFVGQYLNNVGVTYVRLEDYEAAGRTLERALTIYERTLRPDHLELGRLTHNLGVVAASLGDIELAYTRYRKAMEIKVAALGPDHVSVALSSNNVGDSLIRLGRSAEAIPYIEDALRIWTKAEGEDGVGNMLGYISLAEAHLELRQTEPAEAAIRRALALAEHGRGEVDPINVAKGQFVGARVIWAAGGSHDEARTLAQAARAGYEASDRPSTVEIAKIDEWLAHPE